MITNDKIVSMKITDREKAAEFIGADKAWCWNEDINSAVEGSPSFVGVSGQVNQYHLQNLSWYNNCSKTDPRPKREENKESNFTVEMMSHLKSLTDDELDKLIEDSKEPKREYKEGALYFAIQNSAPTVIEYGGIGFIILGDDSDCWAESKFDSIGQEIPPELWESDK